MPYEVALSALADPTRRAVFERLRGGPLSVGRLAEGLPVSRPAVSQHLAVLSRAGLVRERRDGARRLYAVNPAALAELRDYFDEFWGGVLDAFKQAAEKEHDHGATAG